MRPYWLYRFYGEDDVLLYVGITVSMPTRMKQHARDKSWWEKVHRGTFEWFPGRAAAEAAERGAIQGELPVYNKAYNERGASVRAFVAEFGIESGLAAIVKSGLDLGLLRVAHEAEMVERFGDGQALVDAVETALECDHSWWDEWYPTNDTADPAYRCGACRASPEFVKAAKGVIMLDMLCHHELYGDLIDDIGVHVHAVEVAEGLWPSCEMDMPGWGDE